MTFKPNLGRLDDVTATNGTALASAHEHGSVCSDATYTDGVFSASAHDHISILGTIIASVPDLAFTIGYVLDSMALQMINGGGPRLSTLFVSTSSRPKLIPDLYLLYLSLLSFAFLPAQPCGECNAAGALFANVERSSLRSRRSYTHTAYNDTYSARTT